MTGADQYTVWNADNNGNYVSSLVGVVSGGNSAFKALETSFQQDLNGDGTIGVPATTVEAFGSTKLDQVGSNFYLDSISTGSGPSLKWAGARSEERRVGKWWSIRGAKNP